MIATVSTVKDNLANVQRFVNANLAGGVDHMFVFLDDRDPDVEAWLSARDEVTLVVADASWWNGTRPKLLNKRQRLNANLVKAVLSLTDWAEWLFHIDADEVAQVDRAALAKLPSEQRVVRLQPLEVVSKMHWDAPPTLFKRLLRQPELDLLFTLGLLPEPTNPLYFRSHVVGKVGIRPGLDLVLKIHAATDRRGNTVKAAEGSGFTLLHYESFSGEDFIRKWTAMVGSGPSIHFGPHRMRVANAMKALLSMDLDGELAERYLTQIYERHVADPVDVLGDLGLLVEVEPLTGGHVPETLSEPQKTHLRASLEALRTVDKRVFLPEFASPRKVPQVLKGLPRPSATSSPSSSLRAR